MGWPAFSLCDNLPDGVSQKAEREYHDRPLPVVEQPVWQGYHPETLDAAAGFQNQGVDVFPVAFGYLTDALDSQLLSILLHLADAA